MDIKELEVFEQTYRKVETICTEIMNKLACEEGGNVYECIVNSEFPEFESVYIDEDGDVAFSWYEENCGREIERGFVRVPKEVIINENIDEWCEIRIKEHHKQLEQVEEQRERKLYEELKKKYGNS
jgi:hypothetical protein